MNSASIQFINLIHANNDYVRFAFKDSKWNESNLAISSDLVTTMPIDNADTYISFNTFDGLGKQSSNVISLSGFYLDLDFKNFHNSKNINLIELSKLHEDCDNIIDSFIEKGLIAAPTLICSTGCGKAIYYLFNKSLSVSDKESLNLYMESYEKLYMKFKDLFKDIEFIDIDHSVVNDFARVCRVIGTKNTKSNTLSTIDYIGKKYDLNEIINNNNLDDIKLNISGKNTESIITNKDNVRKLINNQTKCFLINRKNWLEDLTTIRDMNVNSCRELLLFIYNWTCRDLYGSEKARALSKKLNESFIEPLDEYEFNHAINAINKYEYTNYYKNSTLIQNLKISDDEIKTLGIGSYSEKIQLGKENILHDVNRDKEVCRLYLSGLSHKKVLEALPDEYKCCLRTIKTITAKYNITKERTTKLEDIDFDSKLKYQHKNSKKRCKLSLNLYKYNNNTINTSIDEEAQSISEASNINNTISEFEKWLIKYNYKYLYDYLEDLPYTYNLSKEEFNVWQSFLNQFPNAKKLILKKIFNKLDKIHQMGYEDINRLILELFNAKDLSDINLLPVKSDKQILNAKYYYANKYKWDWLKDTNINVSELLKIHRKLYIDIYNSDNELIFIDNIPYLLKDFKSKILYHLSIDDICNVADLGIFEEKDILIEWLDISNNKGFNINPINDYIEF